MATLSDAGAERPTSWATTGERRWIFASLAPGRVDHRPLEIPVTRYLYRGHQDPRPLGRRPSRDRIASGNPWSAGCGETRRSAAEGGPGKRAGGDSGTAPRSDPDPGGNDAGERPDVAGRELGAHVADVTARTSSSYNWPWCFSPHDVIRRSCGQPGYPAGLRASQTVRLVRTVRSSRADRAGARVSSSAMSPALSLSSRPCRARQRVTMA